MFLLAVVVITSTFFVVFMDEIGGVLKTLWTKPNEHMFIPLCVITGLSVAYEDYVITCLNGIRLCIQYVAPALLWEQVLCIFLLASFPAWTVFAVAKYNAWKDAAAIVNRVYLIGWLVVIITAMI